MAIGSGAQTLQLLPDVAYVVDAATFMAETSEQVDQIAALADPGAGKSTRFSLPDSGIVSKLTVIFVGQLVSTAAGGGQTQPVPGEAWPYGLMSDFVLSANGMAHDLWSVDGRDLDALRFVRNPNFVNNTDIFPGAVGGGGSAIAAGTYPLHLTWEVPIAVDETYLVGSLFAQSSQTTIAAKITREAEANLIAPSGTAALWTISGTFYVVENAWDIPVNAKGELVVPDITRLHTVVAVPEAFTQTGDVEIPLIRTAGQLMRCFVSADAATNAPLTAAPGTATTSKIDRIALRYGLHAQPINYDPASALVSLNDQYYGGPVPYDRHVLDFWRRNPARDAVLLQGVTKLRAVVTVDPAVAVTAGQAFARAVEEILI